MNKRLGFHYFQDTSHYQQRDLQLWVPELSSLNAGWLVIKSSAKYAIPEEFISGLIETGIQPVIQFDFQVNSSIKPDDVSVLLSQYAKWGVRYVIFFNLPNKKSAWVDGTWSQGDLVERFMDRYLQFVRLAQKHGLISVFPPLQPGGDYWDLSFLKKVFLLAQQRRSLDFSSNFHMAVSAQSFGHPLSWGSGAGSKWSLPHPYSKAEIGEEDHIGFNTWQWYNELALNTLNIAPKFLLFYYGAANISSNQLDNSLSFETLVDLLSSGTIVEGKTIELPENVIGCMFWLLQVIEEDPSKSTALFDAHGAPRVKGLEAYKQKLEQTRKQSVEYPVADRLAEWMYPIDHYLLLPSYEWGIPENTLDRIRPIIRDARPTIGFSLIEALNARKVTVWNENAAFSEHDIQLLREAGCLLDEQVINSIGVPA